MYFALGSICGNTFVSDAAANTVGTDPPLSDDVLVAGVELDVAAGEDVEVELELLLPQPAARAHTATAISTDQNRPDQIDLITTMASLSTRQNPGILTESWQ